MAILLCDGKEFSVKKFVKESRMYTLDMSFESKKEFEEFSKLYERYEFSEGVFYFDSVSGIDKVDYTLDYDENPYYKPVVNDLSVEQTFNDENVTVSVTNNSTNPALFVSAYAIFFDSSNNVVNYNSTYITDSDSEIKPGKTISDQLDCYGKYDHAEVYFTGRADK